MRRGDTRSTGWVLPNTNVGWATSRTTATRRRSGRNCSTSKRGCEEGEDEDGDEGGAKPQEAAARYGSHSGSTSERCRNRQRCPSGGAGLTPQRPTQLGEQLVGLHEIVLLAGRHDVGPVVRAAPAAGDHVVDRVGRLRAIDTEAAVAAQHRATGHGRRAGPPRDPHHVAQADDRGDLDLDPRRVEDLAVLTDGDRLGPPGEHEHDGTTIGDEGKRLVGRIEEEHPLHTPRGYPPCGPRPLTPAKVGHDVGRLERLGDAVAAVWPSRGGSASSASPGSGKKGGRCHHPRRASRHSAPSATHHRPGCGSDGPPDDDAAVPAPCRPAPPTAHPSPPRATRRPRCIPPAPSRHSPTRRRADERAARHRGPRAPPAPPERSRARNERSISACAAAKKGAPKPSATDPLTTANGRSSRFTTDAMARPTSVPVRSTNSGRRVTRWPARQRRDRRARRLRLETAAAPARARATVRHDDDVADVARVAEPPVEQPPVEHDPATDPGRHHHAEEVSRSRPPRRPTPRPAPAPWRRCRRTSAAPSAPRAVTATGTHATPRCSTATPSSPPALIGPPQPAPHTTSRSPAPTPADHPPDEARQVAPQQLAGPRLRRRPRTVVPGRHRRPLDQGAVQRDQPGCQLGAADVDGERKVSHGPDLQPQPQRRPINATPPNGTS